MVRGIRWIYESDDVNKFHSTTNIATISSTPRSHSSFVPIIPSDPAGVVVVNPVGEPRKFSYINCLIYSRAPHPQTAASRPKSDPAASIQLTPHGIYPTPSCSHPGEPSSTAHPAILPP